MPTILREGPYRFQFYSSDGVEPRHIHVTRGGADAKFWLDPAVNLSRNRGYPAKELRDIQKLVEENVRILRDAWDDHFRA